MSHSCLASIGATPPLTRNQRSSSAASLAWCVASFPGLELSCRASFFDFLLLLQTCCCTSAAMSMIRVSWRPCLCAQIMQIVNELVKASEGQLEKSSDVLQVRFSSRRSAGAFFLYGWG